MVELDVKLDISAVLPVMAQSMVASEELPWLALPLCQTRTLLINLSKSCFNRSFQPLICWSSVGLE